MNLQDFRSQYPQYDNVPDDELTQRLYQKHYGDKMSFDDFHSKFAGTPTAEEPLAQDQVRTFGTPAPVGTTSRTKDVGLDVLSQTEQLGSAGLEAPKLIASLGNDNEAPSYGESGGKIWAGVKRAAKGVQNLVTGSIGEADDNKSQLEHAVNAAGGIGEIGSGAGGVVRRAVQDTLGKGNPDADILMWGNRKLAGAIGNSSPVVNSQAWLDEKSKQAQAAMSPEYQMSITKAAVEQDENGDYKAGAGLSDPWWWAHGGINLGVQAPLMFGPPAWAARVGYGTALRGALEKAALDKVPQSIALQTAAKEAQAAGTRAAVIAGGLTEGGISGAQDAQQTEQTINQIDEETLLHYEPYRRLREQGMTHEQARAEVAKDKAMAVGIASATVVGLTGAPLNAWIGKWATVGTKAGLVKRTLGGFAAEGAQEGIQSGAEQAIQNKAEQPITGKDTWDDVLNQTVSGGLIAGVFGGAGGALMGHGGKAAKPVTEAQERAKATLSTAQEAYTKAQDNLDTAEAQARDPNVRLKYDDLVAAREAHQQATVDLAHAALATGELDAKTQQTVAQALHDARQAGVEPTEGSSVPTIPTEISKSGPLTGEEQTHFDTLDAVAKAQPVDQADLHRLVGAGLVKVSPEGQPILLPEGRRQRKTLEKRVVAAEQQASTTATEAEKPPVSEAKPAVETPAATSQSGEKVTLSVPKKRKPVVETKRAIEIMIDRAVTPEDLDKAETAVRTAAVGGTDTGTMKEALAPLKQKIKERAASVDAGLHPDTITNALEAHNESGGFTIDPRTGKLQKSGWAFAPRKENERVFDAPPSPAQVSKYAKDNADLLAVPGNYLGGWANEGKHYLDVSQVSPSRDKAEQAASLAEQQAIMNLDNFEEVKAADFKPENTAQPVRSAAAVKQKRANALTKAAGKEKTLRFKHFSPTNAASLELNPNRQGTGLRGEEAHRDGEKVVSFYGEHGKVEPGLQNLHEYHADIPESQLYDANEDHLGLAAKANVPVSFTLDEHGKMQPSQSQFDFGEYERLIKKAGYKGYHMPKGKGILRGQARMFVKTKATNVKAQSMAAAKPKVAKPTKAMAVDEALKHIAGFLTPQEKSALHRGSAKKLADLFHELPDDRDLAAAAIAGQAKRGWYERSAKAIVNVFGPDAPRFSALLAALSPQTSVEQNFKNAVSLFVAWDKAGRPTDSNQIRKLMANSLFPGGNRLGKVGVLYAWVPNSIRALTSETPDTLTLSGPKVDSFSANLRGETNRVTLDAWMANFANINQTLFSGSLTKSGPGTGPGYLAFTARVRQAADTLTKMTGDTWTPAEVQETVWSWAKTLYEHTGSYKGLATAQEILADKELTDELINSTPDFTTQFFDPTAEKILRDAGYGDRLDQLTGQEGAGGNGRQKVAPLEGDSERLNRAAGRLDALRVKRETASTEKAAAAQSMAAVADRGSPFYSRAIQAADALTLKSASGDQWLASLKNQPGVRQDELDYMGLPEWLAEQGKVSKDDLLDFMRANQLQLQEAVLGQSVESVPLNRSNSVYAGDRGEDNPMRELLSQAHIDEDSKEEFMQRMQNSPSTMEWLKNEYPDIAEEMSEGLDWAQTVADDVYSEHETTTGPATKYASYVTPSGSNYREMLIKLPSFVDLGELNGAASQAREAFDAADTDMVMAELSGTEEDKTAARIAKSVAAEKLARARQTQRDADRADYSNGHFAHKNVLAHVRFNDRIDANGKRTLFVEEVQSDWHQKGRKQGYTAADAGKKRKAALDAIDNAKSKAIQLLTEIYTNKFLEADGSGEDGAKVLKRATAHAETIAERVILSSGKAAEKIGVKDLQLSESQLAVIRAYDDAKQALASMPTDGMVPDAPFKTSWPELVMKRMIRYAAENGYHQIAWTTGEMQNERYSLAQHIDRVTWISTPGTDTGTLVAHDKNRSSVINQMDIPESRLEEFVGKEATAKLLAAKIQKTHHSLASMGTEYRELENADLKVGGEGMNAFYDKMLPSILNKYTKKWGGKVGTTTIGSAYAELNAGSQPLTEVHALELTPAMHEAAMEGQPLFAVNRTQSPGMTTAQVESAISGVRKELGLDIQVVASEVDLPPEAGQHAGLALQGLFVPDVTNDMGGTMYVVASNLDSAKEAVEIAVHESVGHMGLRAMLGEHYNAVMDMVAEKFPALVVNAAKRNQINLQHSNVFTRLANKRLATEEMIAYATGQLFAKQGISARPVKAATIWGRVMDFIRDKMRSLGLLRGTLKDFSADDLNKLMFKARDYTAANSKRAKTRNVYEGKVAAAAKDRPLGSAPHNPDLDSFLKKIGSDDKPLRQKWNEFKNTIGDKIAMGAFDHFHGIKRASTLAGVSLGDAGYYNARLSGNSAELVQSMMEFGHPVWNGDAPDVEGEMGFLDILKPLGNNVNSWLAYMVAKRAQRLAGEGRENLFAPNEIQAALDLGKQHPEFEPVAKRYAEFQSKVLDFAQQAGIISGDSRALWENQDYIPFHRLVENGEVQQRPTGGKGIGYVKNQIVKLKGGRANLGDPMENIVRNWLALTDAALKAHAARSVVDGLNDTGLVSSVPITNQIVPAHTVKDFVKNNPVLAASLKSVGVDVNKLDPAQLRGLQQQLAVPPPKEEGTISVWRNGQREHWAVHDEMLFNSLNGINAKSWGPMMELLRAPKRLITGTVTITPQFLLKNIWRDMWHTFIVGTHDGKTIVPIKDTIIGTIDSMKMDKTAQSMLAGGGSFAHGWIFGGDTASGAAAIRRTVKAHRKSKSAAGVVLNSPLKLFRFYRKLQNASENANRVAIYRKALASGRSRSEALYEARDIMDFNMRGDNAIMRFLAESVPFLNARLQGLYRLGRGVTKKTAAGMFLRGSILAALSLAILARNWKDDRYKELSDDQKSNYWHLWDVFQKGDHWQIPKPFETGAVFGTIPEIMGDAFLSNQDEPNRAAIAASLVGYTFGQQLNMAPQPAAVWPMIELATNRNSYTGAPVLTQGDQGVLPEDQVGPNTSPTYRAIAQMMPSMAPEALRSPKQLEFLGRAYVGNVQDYVLLMTDKIVRSMKGEPEVPKATSNDWPGLRDFRRVGPSAHTKYMDSMYDIADKAEQVYQSLNKANNAGTTEGDKRADEITDNNQSLLDVRGEFQNAVKQVSDLKKQQRQIQLDTTMTPDDKRSQIDELQAEINDTAQGVWDLRPGGKLNPDVGVQLLMAPPQKREQILRKNGLPATADLLNQSQQLK